MQPDLLTPEKEEKQSEPLACLEEMALPSPLATELEPSESIPLEQPTEATSTPETEKKRGRLNFAVVILGIFVFFLLLGAAGLGYGVYVLRTELISTQQQLASLQGKYSKLQNDFTTLTSKNENLKAELVQAKTDLGTANDSLITAQADLKKEQDQNKELNGKIDKASKFAKILYSWFTTKNPSDLFNIDSQIRTVGDPHLSSLWSKIKNSPSDDKFGELILYLVTTIQDNLK